MQVKRFEAPDTKSALALVKERLGPDAVILSTRKIQPDPASRALGRSAPWVEVVAAVDFDVESTVSSISRAESEPIAGKRAARALVDDSDEDIMSSIPSYNRRKSLYKEHALPLTVKENAREKAAVGAASPVLKDDSEGEISRGIINLSREARLLSSRFGGLLAGDRQKTDQVSENATGTGGESEKKGSAKPRHEDVISWRNQILEQIRVRPLQVGDGDVEGGGAQVIALVGPTGVGKTTTAAKIAAWFTLNESARVALISMDCYRIGATEQLRTYARIMRLPCEIVMKEQDLAQALKKHRNKDLVIIDTAGKSPYDQSHIPELLRWFEPHRQVLPYLVLSATAKKEDIGRIVNTYRPLGVPAAILTKLDETRAYATLCQQLVQAELPVSCLCTGQKVPEDFMLASKEFLQTLFGQGWDKAMVDN